MAEFINTIDVLGEDVIAVQIIERSITEFKDSYITKLGKYAFVQCTELTTVDVPNVEEIGESTFAECPSLISVNLPKLKAIPAGGFGTCHKLRTLVFPSVTRIAFAAWASFGTFPVLDTLDLHTANEVYLQAFQLPSLKHLILRSTSKVCRLETSFNGIFKWGEIPIGQGDGYIYVPASLVEQYKAYDRFSAVADRIVALEDHTEDGTIMGDILVYDSVTNQLSRVTTSNTTSMTVRGRPYHAILTPETSDPITSVRITMDGVNVTNEVYNAETGEITIESVTGDIVIYALAAGLLHNWDLTNGLTDTVGGVNITLSSTAKINEAGLTIGDIGAYATIPSTVNYDNSVMEFDISAMSRTGGSHGRFIMFSPDRGFIYRSNGYWQIYNGGWTGTTTIADSNYFAGKTLTITQTLESGVYYWTVDVDGTNVVPKTKRTDVGNIMIGSSAGQSYYSVTITGIRIYAV